jgi:serine/threonine protein kinase
MIGSVVGSYKITEKIGEGGMGAVFKGVDVMLEREVAIKMLRPELARNPQIVERFRTEAVTLAKLNHPYIATLYSFLRQGDDFFMVMEFVRGDTLDTVIRKTGPMAAERAVALFCQALEGIEHAHSQGIIHRDIKPANMMLAGDGAIKVMDFGIARVLGTDRLTKTGHLIGTVEYMSPEQIRGEETDGRSDVYSLGILLYEMLTGRVPFTSTSEYELMRRQIEDAPTPPRVFASQVPLAVEQIIMRALAKKPEARHQSAGEFRSLLVRDMWPSTTPVDRPIQPVQYAAPATRLGNPMATAEYPGVPSHSGVVTDPGLRETRLATAHTLPPSYAATPVPHISPAPAPQRSLLSSLNWKHYAGAAAFLLLLIAVPLALIVGGDRQAPGTQPAEATQPAQNPSTSAPPAREVQSGPAQSGPAFSPEPLPQNGTPGNTTGKQPRKRGTGQAATTPPSSTPPKTQPKPEEKKKKWWQKIPGVIDKVTKKPRQ